MRFIKKTNNRKKLKWFYWCYVTHFCKQKLQFLHIYTYICRYVLYVFIIYECYIIHSLERRSRKYAWWRHLERRTASNTKTPANDRFHQACAPTPHLVTARVPRRRPHNGHPAAVALLIFLLSIV